jgi:hypothetical protein
MSDFSDLQKPERIRHQIDIMPDVLRINADEFESLGGLVQAQSLREAADMIVMLRRCVADAIRRPMGFVPTSCEWITSDELDEAEERRSRADVCANKNSQ